MSEAVSVECGMCRRRFRCQPEMRERNVRCPYCKTIVKVPAASETGREALQAMSDLIAREKAEREKQPVTARHHGGPVSVPVRSKNVAIISLVLVGVGLVAAAIALVLVFGGGGGAGDRSGPGLFQIGDRSPFHRENPHQAPGAPPAPPGAPTKAGPPGTAAPRPVKPVAEAVTVKVERLLGGYRDGTLTYAAGRVTNNTAELQRVVKVVVSIFDKDDKELGEATAIVLNLPAGATAPFVAEWPHAEDVIGRKHFPNYQLNPGGVPAELPAVASEDAVAIRDPNAMATTGRLRVIVTNQGALPLPAVHIQAVLVGDGGKVVGAVRGQVDKMLPPKKPVEISIPWSQCAGHLVQGCEVWVQPAW
ncbi:MAG: hypothetical protein FJ288_07795 [Planctomycetes bacterium]|nr:hypothetical protein [Planctomycetota bacterium]